MAPLQGPPVSWLLVGRSAFSPRVWMHPFPALVQARCSSSLVSCVTRRMLAVHGKQRQEQSARVLCVCVFPVVERGSQPLRGFILGNMCPIGVKGQHPRRSECLGGGRKSQMFLITAVK